MHAKQIVALLLTGAVAAWLGATVAIAATDKPGPSPELVQAWRHATQQEAENRRLEAKVRRQRRLLRGYGQWVRDLQRQNRLLRRDAQVGYQVQAALAIACAVYPAHCSTLRRKIRCESHNWPYAKNPRSTASGLGQFLDSTWASTPFAGLSVFNPYANALGVGWMHDNGRGGEWVCR